MHIVEHILYRLVIKTLKLNTIMEKVVKNQSRFQYGQIGESSKAIQRLGINRISPNKIIAKESITPEISKGIYYL